jgi:hypothetical protein
VHGLRAHSFTATTKKKVIFCAFRSSSNELHLGTPRFVQELQTPRSVSQNEDTSVGAVPVFAQEEVFGAAADEVFELDLRVRHEGVGVHEEEIIKPRQVLAHRDELAPRRWPRRVNLVAPRHDQSVAVPPCVHSLVLNAEPHPLFRRQPLIKYHEDAELWTLL